MRPWLWLCVVPVLMAALAVSSGPVRVRVTPLMALAPAGATATIHVSPLQDASVIVVELEGPVSSVSAVRVDVDGTWLTRDWPRLPEGAYVVVVTVWSTTRPLASATVRFRRG